LFLTAREFDKDESFQGFPKSRDRFETTMQRDDKVLIIRGTDVC